MLKSSSLLLFTLCLTCSPYAIARAADDGLIDLGGIGDGSYSGGNDVSANGQVIVGYAEDANDSYRETAFRWTQEDGLQSLGQLNGGSASWANAVNYDGSVVVGEARDGNRGNYWSAFRWTQDTGMQSLGTLNDGWYSSAYNVSANGQVIVGIATDGNNANKDTAYRWTQEGGMESLGMLNDGNASAAIGVSYDGSVIVGKALDGNNGNTRTAIRWTREGGIESLGMLNGGSTSNAVGVSGDGNVIFGNAADGNAGDAPRAMRWTQDDGMLSLGVLNGGSESYGDDINGDGSVIVGAARDGANGGAWRAFRWTQDDGMISVEDWLRNNGMTIAQDRTVEAYGVSEDGSVITGYDKNDYAFMARVSSLGTGLVFLQDYAQTLEANTLLTKPLSSQAELTLNGAHSIPLRNLLDAGQSSLMVSADIGQDNGSDYRGLSDILYSHGLGKDLQIGVAIGYTDNNIDLAYDGALDYVGTYIAPEAIWHMNRTFYLTINGYYSKGKADTTRGYLNAGSPDYSLGDADTLDIGGRVRLDWRNAVTIGNTALTPNISHTYVKSRVGAYTETGGAFPVQQDTQTQSSNVTRVGVDAVHTLSDKTRLLGKVEGAYRAEAKNKAVTGRVIGLGDFSLGGQDNQRFWGRFGAGVETDVGKGSFTVMLNATTKGPATDYWGNVSYRVKF